MAATPTKPRSTFGEILKTELDEQGVTIRELARRMTASDDFTEIESKRRMLQRYLRGDVQPNERVRNEIADALAVPRQRFDEDRERERWKQQIMASLDILGDVFVDLLERAVEAKQK